MLKKLFNKQVQQQKKDYAIHLKTEIQDFLRTGDLLILKRILFKMFVNSNIPLKLKKKKSHLMLMLLIENHFGENV